VINWFCYDKKNSYNDFGLIVKDKSVYSSAAPDVSSQEIPGRSGDVIIDNKRFNNVDISYTCAFISEDFAAAARKIRAIIVGAQKYKRLYDTYDPNYFRYAVIKNAIDITQKGINDGEAKIYFNCKPYLYSFAGQQTVTLTSAGTITNYEAVSSLPYIKIYGSGKISLTINGNDFNMYDVDEYIELDSETMTAYKGETKASANINSQTFPSLEAGVNAISWTGTVSKIEIIPRWRTV